MPIFSMIKNFEIKVSNKYHNKNDDDCGIMKFYIPILFLVST